MAKGIILAAHKPIAGAMLQAATGILGPLEHVAAADIDSDATEKDQVEHLKYVFSQVDSDEVIFLLDIEGATPCNVLKKFCSAKRCMIISPLSFPLFFKMLNYRHLSFEELAKKAEEVKPVVCGLGSCV